MSALKMSRSATYESIRNQAWMIDERAMQNYLARLENDVVINAALDDPDKLEEMRSQYSFERSRAEQMTIQSGTALIDIKGVLEPSWNWLSAYYGETTLDVLKANFDSAIANEDVQQIVFMIDSPGGIARGNEELSAHINAVCNGCGKRVRSYVEGYMASAAYYLGSAAQEIVAGKTAVVGSIGTILIHAEISKMAEEFGITFTVVKYGQYKADGNQYEQLSEQARESLQEMVNDHGEMFVNAVARNRGISAERVRTEYGDGKAFLGPRALERGLIDGISDRSSFLSNIKGESDMANENAVSREEFLSFQEKQTEQNDAVLKVLEGINGRLDAQETREQNNETAAKIAAKCRMAGQPERAEEFIKDGLSLEEVTSKLLDGMCENRDTAGDDADHTESSEEAKVASYKREYQETREIHEKLGVSEESYIESRKIEDGLIADPFIEAQRKMAFG